MSRQSEKGVALILTLILVMVISVMAFSLMFVAQTETWSSFNYRMMSQARDAAEAGIYASSNYVVNSYSEPGTLSSSNFNNNRWSLFPVSYASTTSSDPTSAYNTTVTPVQYPSTYSSGHDVVLSANTGLKSANYPVSSVQSAFNSNGVGYGTIGSGGTTATYSTYATLMSMKQAFIPFGKTSPTTVQTWKLTSQGSISGVRAANVQISATLEQHVFPTFNYAAFATDAGCSALQFGGGGQTDSYDSTAALVGGVPSTTATGGNVGTNGNLGTNGSPTTIYGTLSTPRSGVGSCTSSNVTAWTDTTGSLSCGAGHTNSQCLVPLAQSINYPTPDAPSPTPPSDSANSITLNNKSSDCNSINGCSLCPNSSGTCTHGDFYLAPGTCPNPANPGVDASGPGVYGDITIKGNVHLTTGCYNIDSLAENGGGTLYIDSGPVVVNILGANGGVVMDLTGGGMINSASPAYSPSTLEFLYAGSGTIKLKGGANSIGLMYAPNSTYSISGGANWYGALIGKDLTDLGGSSIHYDRHLQNTAYTVGPWMLNSFSWKKF